MQLAYDGSVRHRGKTSDDSDVVEVRLTKLEEGRLIEQEVAFESEDPAFAGLMRMVWTFQPEGRDTLVTVRAGNVPEGILPADHETGLTASLDNLARFVEDAHRKSSDPAAVR